MSAVNGPDRPAFPAPGDLLPHRPPMLLLRAVLGHRPGETCCEACFGDDFARLCGGQVPVAFGLELIAQAAAVHHALSRLEGQGSHERAPRGLLLGSRRLRMEARSLPTNEPLRVIVLGSQEPSGPGGLIRFEGRVEDAAGRLLVGGDATVLESPPDVLVA